MSKIYGYARVSAVHQDLEIQINELHKFGVDELFHEKKNMRDRKEFNRMIEQLEKGDTVVVYKLDRLGRSITDVVRTYESFQEKGMHIVSISENIDTRRNNDFMTKAMITLLGLFAEMERNFINERTMAGKLTAKAKGIKLGRKGKKKSLVDHAIELWQTGEYTIREIEEKTTVKKSTLYREIEKRGLNRI